MANRGHWQEALTREAAIRSGLVLYGNTRDLFWSGAGCDYLTLAELLVRRLAGFTIRATWDAADGLRFADEREARRWDEVVERRVAAPATGTDYDVGDRQASSSPTSRKIDLLETLEQYRLILAEPRERPLLVLDWSHLLVTQPAHPDAQERGWLLRLAKALAGEPLQRIDSDSLQRRGLMVLLAASLGSVPPILYQSEPRVRLLSVPMPTSDERRAFFERHRDDLQVEAVRAAPGGPILPAKAGAATIAELTDQQTTADLRQIVALSKHVAVGLRPDRLVDLYRLGEQRSPWEDLSEEKLQHVRETLRQRVVGQDVAVESVATMIVRAWLGLAGLQHSARRAKPKGTLFFVGPTGVGKTELAKACAEFLFGDDSACQRFDMSEYNHEHSDQRLVGAPPGYVGFEDGGQLTNAVTARPFSLLLFDEIEKAHGRVLDKFLQILEDGRLTDGRGETAWFSETVIVFTSNIGASDWKGGDGDYDRHFREAVEHHFKNELKRPELLNRLGDNIVVFQPVVADDTRRDILARKLQPLHDHLQERWGVGLRLDDEVTRWLVSRSRTEHGGRGLLNAVERDLVNPLAGFLFGSHAKLRRGRSVVAGLVEGAVRFELVDD